ncbi:replication initiator protein A [Staphylococcus pasteuri]|uniref:replication initiator protein A n=1 Tax=Staphylococcus pasteuri TaxID=45972 RepID=UPI001C3F5826|nr:replication initiator protein A [Staphylococcus pasteuri]
MSKIEYKPFTNSNQQPFMKLYKFIWLESSYKHLPNQCKVLFSGIKNLIEQAKYNGKIQYNDNQQPYIVLDNKKIQTFFGLDTKTIKKYKDALYDCGLLIKGTRKKEIIVNDAIQLDHHCSSFINKETNERELSYIAMPKFLFNDVFKHVSLNAKVMYSIYRDRFKLSLKNSESSKQYVDQAGKVFTVIANQDLCAVLNCSKNTISKYTGQLIAIGLIQKQQINCQSTDRIYVKEPIALPVNVQNNKEVSQKRYRLTTRNHVYMKHIYRKTGNSEIKNGNFEYQKWEKLGYSNTNFNQTYNHINTNLMLSNVSEDVDEYEKMIQQEQKKLVPSFDEFKIIKDKQKQHKLKNLPPLLKVYFNRFNDVQEMSAYLGIMFNAKNEFNKYHDTSYAIEDVEYQLSAMIKTVFNAFKKDNAVKNHYAYFSSSVYNVFVDCYDEDYENGIISRSREELIQQQMSEAFTQLENNIQHQTNMSYHSVDEAELDMLEVY